MNLNSALNWRYAVKRMNGEKVAHEKVESILESIRLSASSMGLQPYDVIVIEDLAVRERLKKAAYNQPQITEGSHVIVFAAWKNITKERVDEYIENIKNTRGVTDESLSGFRSALMNIADNKSEEEQQIWAAKQTYIGLGTGLAAAALEKVDSTPMEGFIPEEVDKVLELDKYGLKSVNMLVLGVRDEATDYLVNAKKVRRSKDKMIKIIS